MDAEDEYIGLEHMLEVVVQEEDQELDISNASEAPVDLPPIPTFDLRPKALADASSKKSKAPPPKPKPPKPVSVKQLLPKATAAFIKAQNELLSLPNFHPTKTVFVQPDRYPKDLNIVSDDEMGFYNTVFSDLKKIVICKLDCTICDKHIGNGASAKTKVKPHRMMKVLLCNGCLDFYGDGKFPTDASDNTEIFCRWCGQGGDLVCCSFCPAVFCNKCVIRNFDSQYLKEIEDTNEWACFCCAQMPLWPLRAITRALIRCLDDSPAEDTSTCCGKRKEPRAKPKKPIIPAIKSTPKLVEKPVEKQVLNPMVVIQPGILPSTSKSVPSKTVVLPLPKPKVCPTVPSPRPVPLPTPTTSRPRQNPPRVAAPKPPTVPPPAAPQGPRPLPTNMPKVWIDHSILDTTVVRIRLSNSKEQYLRVNVTGSCQRLPKFPVNPSITMTTLYHAFQLNKSTFEKLKALKESIEKNKKCDIIEEATTIRSLLTHWKEMVQTIENDLTHNVRVEMKKNKATMDDVIDLSDEEEDSGNFEWKYLEMQKKENKDEDSDVEIIDCSPPPTASTKRKASDTEGENASKKQHLMNGEVSGRATNNSRRASSNSVDGENVLKAGISDPNKKEGEKKDSVVDGPESKRADKSDNEKNEKACDLMDESQKEVGKEGSQNDQADKNNESCVSLDSDVDDVDTETDEEMQSSYIKDKKNCDKRQNGKEKVGSDVAAKGETSKEKEVESDNPNREKKEQIADVNNSNNSNILNTEEELGTSVETVSKNTEKNSNEIVNDTEKIQDSSCGKVSNVSDLGSIEKTPVSGQKDESGKEDISKRKNEDDNARKEESSAGVASNMSLTSSQETDLVEDEKHPTKGNESSDKIERKDKKELGHDSTRKREDEHENIGVKDVNDSPDVAIVHGPDSNKVSDQECKENDLSKEPVLEGAEMRKEGELEGSNDRNLDMVVDSLDKDIEENSAGKVSSQDNTEKDDVNSQVVPEEKMDIDMATEHSVNVEHDTKDPSCKLENEQVGLKSKPEKNLVEVSNQNNPAKGSENNEPPVEDAMDVDIDSDTNKPGGDSCTETRMEIIEEDSDNAKLLNAGEDEQSKIAVGSSEDSRKDETEINKDVYKDKDVDMKDNCEEDTRAVAETNEEECDMKVEDVNSRKESISQVEEKVELNETKDDGETDKETEEALLAENTKDGDELEIIDEEALLEEN